MNINKNYTTFGRYYYRQPRVVRARLREAFKKNNIAMSTVNSWMYDYTGSPRVPSIVNAKIVEKITGKKIETLFPV